jgi:hypothetical protein
VTNVGDNGGIDPAPFAGTGTLRQAIIDADATPGPDVIQFNIASSGMQTIQVLSALPAISRDNITIDGTTEPGYSGAPVIVLDGTNAGTVSAGLLILSGSCTVEGLAVVHFGDVGINIEGNNNSVKLDYIGTSDGVNPAGNGAGMVIGAGASNNTVGAVGAGNVISGNNGLGISILGFGAHLPYTTGNQLLANRIGTTADGSHPLPNGSDGVDVLFGPRNNTIGGTAAGAGNVISGNKVVGVLMRGSGTDGNQVLANYIGTTADGTHPLGNGGSGVIVWDGASKNTVGGVGAGNVISGNTGDGVDINDSGTTGNQVLANYIGTTADGSHALPNGVEGVAIARGASNNKVGAAGAGNVISGNTGDGVFIEFPATGNQVLANYIGTTADGSHPLGNGLNGVTIRSAASNVVGAAGAGNVISGNSFDGVAILFGATGNQVLANLIGTTADAGHPLGNGGDGVLIIRDPNSNNNTVGGAGVGNLIAFNGKAGVVVGLSLGDTSAGDTISQNAIFSNGGLGIDLGNDGVTPNTPGGPHAGPNHLQNYPVLTPYTTPGTLTGTLNSTPNTTFVLEFFANPAPDPTGHGPGQDYLGSEKVTTNAAGNAVFVFTYLPFPGEPYLSATATNATTGDTSEFSATVDAALTPTGLTLAATEGAQFSGTVATFTDADPNATPASFTASIDWGDGAVTPGKVVYNPGGGFAVTGSHTYAEEASTVPVAVTITDVAGNTQATAHSLINVADAPLQATGKSLRRPSFGPFSGVVATFTDADPGGVVADYTATIDWGDGTTSAGIIGSSNGVFTVSGKHTYGFFFGKRKITITIRDAGGSTVTVVSTIQGGGVW